MGQKNSKNPEQRRLKRSDTAVNGLKKKKTDLFFDAVDLEEESEVLKIGEQKTQQCPHCKKNIPTSNIEEIRSWIEHKKNCKKNKNNNNQNNNQSLGNNIINPPNNINININLPSNHNNIIINDNIPQPPSNIPPPPPPPPPPPIIYNNNNYIRPIHQQNNNYIRPVNPPHNNYIRRFNPPHNNCVRPANSSNNCNNNYQFNHRNEKKCPICKIFFRYDSQYYKNQYFQHLKNCRLSSRNNNLNNITISTNTSNRPIRVNAGNQGLNNILDAFGLETKKVLPRGKKDGTFEEKVDYLRFDISKKKIDFINGAEKLNINREKVLENSMDQFSKINPFKELKIIFIGEESHDAGGLIREWLTILFKTILDKETGLFKRSDTDEIGYIIKPNLYPSKDSLNKYFFIGKVLAKALLENLTVNCCFNKLIYQLILGEKIELNDLVFIDRPLYNSMKHLVSMKNECADNIALCEIYFTYEYEGTNGIHNQEDLIENGSDILVTKDNLDLYIQKRIEFYTKSQMGGIKQIITGINTIFPVDYLKIFTSDQLGLLINGTPFIDTEDWRINTIYKNYNDYDDVIVNFWEIISNLSQEELSNFLLFCTGSSRVPIGGFKSLESNRGQISKFEIVKTEYYNGKKNFLRAHTCFNRLDLPNFPDKNTLNEAIKFALENEILGFGIE